ncbi:MAG: hypothetical protein GY696_20795 [Gammaproteobacteria bacterium]|nr:hypothetical protein [Gammaproteobacteria bacterium]
MKQVRKTSAILMLNDIQESALLFGEALETARERNLLIPRSPVTVIAVPVPVQKPHAFQYCCLEVNPYVGPLGEQETQAHSSKQSSPGTNRQEVLGSSRPQFSQPGSELLGITQMDLLTGSPLGGSTEDISKVELVPITSGPSPCSGTTMEEVTMSPVVSPIPKNGADLLEEFGDKQKEMTIESNAKIMYDLTMAEESATRSRTASRGGMSFRWRSRSVGRPNSVASRLRENGPEMGKETWEIEKDASWATMENYWPTVPAGSPTEDEMEESQGNVETEESQMFMPDGAGSGKDDSLPLAKRELENGWGDAAPLSTVELAQEEESTQDADQGLVRVKDVLCHLVTDIADAVTKDEDLFNMFLEKKPELVKRILLLKAKKVL